jgi:hypothetical protein
MREEPRSQRIASLTPIKLWGCLGAVSVVFIVITLGRWIANGVRSIDPGPDPIGTGNVVLLRVLEWGQFAALLFLVGWFVIRPLIRGLPLGFDGLFVLAAIALNFWDPLDNFWVFSFQYNAHFVNVGSWGGFIPGWRSPGAGVWAVPVLFVLGAYAWAFVLASRLGCNLVRRLEIARPTWTGAQRFSVVLLAMVAVAAAAELIFLRTNAIANIRTADMLTVRFGRYDEWPLYNPILFGLTWTAMAWLRWSRDEDGLSAVEQGANQLSVGSHGQSLVRFLAVFAFVQVAYIVLYFVPWNVFALMSDSPVPLPSYFPTP